ncbi:alpha/beta hydrolase [Stenotrophomonas maltophilia]|uniref:alpha/beta fold hydrolase n=1 Tax=Stenotrophomonas maltophilia TaxID=40324 RepID=UPI0018D4D3A0|nr:alpha/beta hydrolase [Stenotrophomonas maltophilia]MBH1836161.1 alpha/beta hydrolase [Stenotrophomonas maltophilia]MDZ5843034.1 alpha/beta hydrolase [Stenotrophomonas maltophilia]UXY48724.1 alpha/beta hydrolase [Stenotrophomonas maltophilia]
MPASPIRLHIEDTGGEGRPVILIHGWPLSAEAWKDQVPILRDAGYRVISYDRRGFGRSEKPTDGYDYDTLAADLAGIIEQRDLKEVTLVGFSMGGGEVARYIANHGESRLHSVVFAAAVPPYLLRTDDNPEGPLTQDKADEMRTGLEQDREAFFDGFTRDFFSANGKLMVTEAERQAAIALCHQSDQAAALGCMKAFATTDFRRDLQKVSVPTLVLHGDSDATVPLEGSGKRTQRAIRGSELVVLHDAPHGCNTSHTDDFNLALLNFLKQ